MMLQNSYFIYLYHKIGINTIIFQIFILKDYKKAVTFINNNLLYFYLPTYLSFSLVFVISSCSLFICCSIFITSLTFGISSKIQFAIFRFFLCLFRTVVQSSLFALYSFTKLSSVQILSLFLYFCLIPVTSAISFSVCVI